MLLLAILACDPVSVATEKSGGGDDTNEPELGPPEYINCSVQIESDIDDDGTVNSTIDIQTDAGGHLTHEDYVSDGTDGGASGATIDATWDGDCQTMVVAAYTTAGGSVLIDQTFTCDDQNNPVERNGTTEFSSGDDSNVQDNLATWANLYDDEDRWTSSEQDDGDDGSLDRAWTRSYSDWEDPDTEESDDDGDGNTDVTRTFTYDDLGFLVGRHIVYEDGSGDTTSTITNDELERSTKVVDVMTGDLAGTTITLLTWGAKWLEMVENDDNGDGNIGEGDVVRTYTTNCE